MDAPDKTAEKSFDVLIAGGGAAGVLAAARLSPVRPDLHIGLIEREPELGGRLRATDDSKRLHSYGLNAASASFFTFVEQLLRASAPDAPELETLISRRQQKVGVLAGNKLTQADITTWFSAKGARTLGGLTAARQWDEVEAILGQGAGKLAAADLSDEDEEAHEEKEENAKSQAFSHHWKKPRKVPAAIVLEHFARAVGVPDLWSAAPAALVGRAKYHSGQLYAGDWRAVFSTLLACQNHHGRLSVETGNRIVDARWENGCWQISAEKGQYSARALIVAQSPWQASGWLRRSEWPAPLLQIASKTKPVSVVVMSETLLLRDVDLPDVVIVPSEAVQIVRTGSNEVSFQATIDFELSLQAPAVVKAVKSLKRARKKLLTLIPGAVTESNHIALQPVAWAQSPMQSDMRWLRRLAGRPLDTAKLAFCGDAYGPGYDGDQNLIRSVVQACDVVAKGLERAIAGATIQNEKAVSPGEPTSGQTYQTCADLDGANTRR